jgi:hypothetical protein
MSRHKSLPDKDMDKFLDLLFFLIESEKKTQEEK